MLGAIAQFASNAIDPASGSPLLETVPIGYGVGSVMWAFDRQTGWQCLDPDYDPTGKPPKQTQRLILPELQRNATDPKLISDTFEYLHPTHKPARATVWRELVRQCEADTGVDLGWVITAADDVNHYPANYSTKDRVTFRDGGIEITDRPKVRDWWQTQHRNRFCVIDGLCHVSGETVPLTTKLEKVKGCPGANGSGASMTTNYRPAFQSWNQGEDHAYVSYKLNHAVRVGLEALLSDRESCLRLGSIAWIAWTESSPFQLDPLSYPADPATFIKSLDVFKARSISTDTHQLHIACLRGDAGRIAVLHYSADEPITITENIKHWFAVQASVFDGESNLTQAKKGQNTKPMPMAFGLKALIEATLSPGQKVNDRTGDINALMRSALFARPLPSQLLARLLSRLFNPANKTTRAQRSMLALCLNYQPMSQSLSDADRQVARLHGRLLALYAQAQKKANGMSDIAQTMAYRSLARYGKTPHVLSLRLAEALGPWRSKLNRNGQDDWLVNEIQRVQSELAEYETPTSFSLYQQGEFAMAFTAELAYKPKEKSEPAK
jgi:hypothetical protein